MAFTASQSFISCDLRPKTLKRYSKAFDSEKPEIRWILTEVSLQLLSEDIFPEQTKCVKETGTKIFHLTDIALRNSI